MLLWIVQGKPIVYWLSFKLLIVYQIRKPNGYGSCFVFQGVVSSSLAVGKNFSFCNSWFALLAARVNPCKWNEPFTASPLVFGNQSWHTPHQYHVLIKVRQKKYGFRPPLYITVTVSLKAISWPFEQFTNKLKIRILSQTSILYLMRHSSVIPISGLQL